MSGKPSSSELPILKALWRNHPLTAKEIHGCIVNQCNWSFSSTRKTLDRMVEKGFVSVNSESGVRQFSPEWTKIKTLAVYIQDLTGRVLELKKAPPVTMFVDSELLNEEELKELEKLLEGEEPKSRERVAMPR